MSSLYLPVLAVVAHRQLLQSLHDFVDLFLGVQQLLLDHGDLLLEENALLLRGLKVIFQLVELGGQSLYDFSLRLELFILRE